MGKSTPYLHIHFQYETDTFEQDMLALYEELDPLYRLVHAYVRKKLRQVYGDQVRAEACVRGSLPWEEGEKVSERAVYV